MPKYSVDQTVKFTYEGREYQGVIQGIKQGTSHTNGNLEYLYWIWTGNGGVWVREAWIVEETKFQ